MSRSGSAGNVVKVNLTVHVAALVLFSFFAWLFGDADTVLVISLGMLLLIVLHVAVCLLLGIVFWVKKDPEYAKGFLLSGLVILLIGASTCFGGGILTMNR